MRSNIERHIDNMFSSDEADEALSLRALVKKEKARSIAYQILAIPLNYIPAILRVVIAPFISIIAAICRHPEAHKPIVNAFSKLGRQIVKDISRLGIFAAELSRVGVGVVTGIVKMLAFVTSMFLSRFGSLFDIQSGHAVHKFFATMHTGLRKLGDLIYPTELAKFTVSAHPKNTINHYESSYKKLLMDVNFDGSVPLPQQDGIPNAAGEIEIKEDADEYIDLSKSNPYSNLAL